MKLSNCLFFVLALSIRRRHRGYLVVRKSRWGRFPHFLYMERGHLVSYIPVNPRLKNCPPPLFHGKVRWGDSP